MKELGGGDTLTMGDNEITSTLIKGSSINQSISAWDLHQLVSIVTTDTLRDSEKRQQELHKRRRNSNMVSGAVIGGLIDGSHGDDSIVDGVLIGAAFGAIATSSPDDPRAQLGLIFQDGEHLSVDVSLNEYTRLQSFWAKNQIKKAFDESSKSFSVRPLNKEEANAVLWSRAGSVFTRYFGFSIAIAFTPFFLSILSGSYFEPHIPFLGEWDVFYARASIFIALGLFLIGGSALLGKVDRYLLEDELDFYKSLNSEAVNGIKYERS